ncbi:ClbS/DfsB family four-helix bundle protein [Agrobacterium sp. a22-2]|uniref:ClbS/DfsB family four-helix bundle protein n=1 Tax=Agrobacterium sp. a22-2 TaxID=2283840 RepID=UPI0014488AAF|nr:ClbS/DfsB family four-helix bundle protein [Agrobacterium sp. a22-2]NKN35509.1 ClbS/DfsB family four-helix bundle protein [Agrobacterium sp. a22-2]
MAIPQTKAELLSAIDTSYRKLAADLKTVPPEKVRDLSLEGHRAGTMISVADLMAYLIGWNELVLKWYRLKRDHLPVDFPETGFKWNELGLLAQKFYEDYAQLSYEELLARLAAAKDGIVSMVSECSNDGLYGGPWYEKYTLGRMIQLNTASPYANARSRLRRWKIEQGLP